MNEFQIHLALTHVPIILSVAGLIILIVSLLIRNSSVIKTSFYILLFAGLFTIPVFVTSEGAEDLVEHMPGVSENIITRHEGIANISMIVISVAAAFSLAGLIVYKRINLARVAKSLVSLAAIDSAGLMAQTAHLGGQIRHTEIRSGFTTQDENTTHGELQNTNTRENKDD